MGEFMFEPAILEKIQPKGASMKVIEKVNTEESDRRFYKASVSGHILDGTLRECEIEFSLPLHNEGIFHINDLQRFVVPKALVDIVSYKPGARLNFFFKNRSALIFEALVFIFDAVFTDFFMTGIKPVSMNLQNEIDGWFKTSPSTQEAPKNAVGHKGLWDLVHINIPNSGLDLTERHFNKEWLGGIDPASTSSGDKVNLSYRLTKGTKIVNGQLIPSGGLFCSTIEDYHMPVSLCPRRTHISRQPYESHIALEHHERPLIGKEPGLTGRHFNTAIMRFKTYNGEDAIVMSQSAAEKMRSAQVISESFHAMGSFRLLVNPGDELTPDMEMAELVDPITQEKTRVIPKKIKTASKIKSIKKYKSSYFGIPSQRIRVTCLSSAVAASGDKVFTRGAIKGVLRVIPDIEMPKDKNGDPIEVIISPESVVGRRAMSVFWEGMANKFALGGGSVIIDHFNPSPSFKELVDMGHGDSEELWYNGEILPEKVWVAPIYMIRLDRIANEIVSVHSGNQSTNGMGLLIDSAKTNGQKRDFAKGAIMVARNMSNILSSLLIKNMRAPHAYDQLRKVLTPEVEQAS